MTSSITKAMVLAAGLGTRLRPLTYTTPKPLLPLNSHRLIDYVLSYLARNGVKDVMINLHHLGEVIRGHVGNGNRYGLNALYSFEKEILGTGGGIKKVESFFEKKPFVSINSDSLLEADLSSVIKRHLETKAAATMVVKKRRPSDPYEGVKIEDGFVSGFGKGEYFYAGLQIIGAEFLDILPPVDKFSCLIKDGYQRLLEKGTKVAAFIYDGYFNDLGTPERYEQAKKDIAEGIYKGAV